MKRKFCNIRINVTKYDDTFATNVFLTPSLRGYATAWNRKSQNEA